MAIQDMFALKGKVALITGASRGIGETLAQALGEAGADVAVASRTLDQSQVVADRIASLGRRSKAFRVDVTSVESIRTMVSEVVAEYGRIDVLVNNAGLNIVNPVLDVTEEDWDRVLDTNLKGTFFCAQAVGRVMVARGYGRIVNMASQMAAVGYFNRASYCASKGGVVQITKVMAVEWARKGVTINAIAPTFIETAMTARMLANEEFHQEVLQRIPMGRIGTPSEVVGAMLVPGLRCLLARHRHYSVCRRRLDRLVAALSTQARGGAHNHEGRNGSGSKTHLYVGDARQGLCSAPMPPSERVRKCVTSAATRSWLSPIRASSRRDCSKGCLSPCARRRSGT